MARSHFDILQALASNGVTGDLRDACASDGTGMGQQIGLAAFRAKRDPHRIASLRFLHKTATYLSLPSHIRQLMKFNESQIYGNDTTRVFAKLFGEGNIFDVATDSSEWRELRGDFTHHLMVEHTLAELSDPMQEVQATYMDELAKANGEIKDVEDFATRFTMDMIAKTRLGFRIFPAEFQRKFSKAVSEAVVKLVNPINSIEVLVPEILVRGARTAWSYLSKSKDKSLDEIIQPAREVLSAMILINQQYILNSPNWIMDVSVRKMWCRKKAEEYARKELKIAGWRNEEEKKKWFYSIANTPWFKDIAENQWPKARAAQSPDVVELLSAPAVLNDAMLFLIVGHETSAKFYQYTWTFLADPKHAHVVQKMREEVQELLTRKGTTVESLNKKDLEELTYCKAVLLEGLRMKPPLPIIKKQVNDKVLIGDLVFKYEFAKKSEEKDFTPEEGKIYLCHSVDGLQYQVMTPKGEFVTGVITASECERVLEKEALQALNKKPLDLKQFESSLPKVRELLSQKEHVFPNWESREGYKKAMAMRDPRKDFYIPKGNYIFVSPLRVHYSPEIYGENAEMFFPERFIEKVDGEDQLKTPDPHAFFPFGFGRRQCAGQFFSKQEVLLALVNTLMKYDFVADHPMRYEAVPVFSLKPVNKISMRFTPRQEGTRPAFIRAQH